MEERITKAIRDKALGSYDIDPHNVAAREDAAVRCFVDGYQRALEDLLGGGYIGHSALLSVSTGEPWCEPDSMGLDLIYRGTVGVNRFAPHGNDPDYAAYWANTLRPYVMEGEEDVGKE